MRYALNVAPINGWETHTGAGAAACELSATGEGIRQLHGDGAADLELSGNGVGYARIHGASSITAELTTSGDGLLAKTGQGAAGLELTADGIGGIVHYPQASLLLELTTNGVAAGVALGQGEGALELSALWGLPNPVVRGAFATAHGSRVMIVQPGARELVVPAGQIRQVREELRQMRATAQNRGY